MFNLIFLGELICNLYQYAGPRKRFWRSAWNCFDFFIVTVGVVLMIGGDALPAPLKKLKLLRALRVFRLFKRVKSLNQIIVALIASIPGVTNAFVIMVSRLEPIPRLVITPLPSSSSELGCAIQTTRAFSTRGLFVPAPFASDTRPSLNASADHLFLHLRDPCCRALRPIW